MALTPQWLDELRARVTLSTLIGRTVRVIRAGREWKACCPFHDEKTPSFTINDAKGFYHCFGCGAHGDAIRWMTDQRGLPFMDAVKELAADAGMTVPAPDPQAAKQAEKRASLHDVMAAAQDWFVGNLAGIEGAAARGYLEKRGISAETVVRAGFGFAPDARDRIVPALSQFPREMLIESGLLIAVDDKTPYDRFRGRLMIPIRDVRGRVIAFGGRILDNSEPKYLNSPDTPLFDKGRTLYNLDKALPASRQSGRMIVVEGYMDAIALTQAGFADVVAPLGTALTETQLEMLWKNVERPLLCFDGDSAGQKAAMRAAVRALPMLKPGHSLDFVTLPAGKDPDDVLRDGGPAAFAGMIAARLPLVERIWHHERTAMPLDTPEERAGLRQRLRAHVGVISDRDVAQHYRAAFDERIDALFRRDNTASRNGGSFRRTPRRGNSPDLGRLRSIDHETLLFRSVLGGLLRYPDVIASQFDLLAGYRPRDRDAGEILARLLAAPPAKSSLDAAALSTILGNDGLYDKAQALIASAPLQFTFNRRAGDRDEPAGTASIEVPKARKDLMEAVRVMVERPMVERAFHVATQAVETRMDDSSFAEQQRLSAAGRALDERLADLMQVDFD